MAGAKCGKDRTVKDKTESETKLTMDFVHKPTSMALSLINFVSQRCKSVSKENRIYKANGGNAVIILNGQWFYYSRIFRSGGDFLIGHWLHLVVLGCL